MALLGKRLFVGNLPANVSQSDVKKKLSRFGDVQSVELKQRNDSEGNLLSSFAFVDIAAKANDLENCFQYFENEPWNRQKVKVQLAKESFLDRLKREQKCLKKANESSVEIEKKSPDSGISFGRKRDLQSPPDSNRREKILSNCKDETAVKKKSRVSGEGVKSPKKRYSSSSETYTANDDSDIVANRTLDWDRDNSRLNGLPKFGGTKLIVGEDDSELTDGGCDIQPHEHSHVKWSSPKDANGPTGYRVNKVKNSRGGVGDACDGETEDLPKKNKNLPMFCGTSVLIGPEKCLGEGVLQCSSPGRKVVKHDVEHDRGVSGSKKKSGKLVVDGLGGGHDTPSQYSEDDCRGEVKSKKAIGVNSVIPTSSHEKQTRIHPERNSEKPKKDLISERKRMNALEERKKTFNLQKEAVKQALSSVDLKSRSNKKIIFDDDDEDMVPEIASEEKKTSTHRDTTQPKLFLDDSDDEDIKNLESAEFKIKPQFEGSRGQKLLEIQSRYGHDSRFNLDERFLESDDDGSAEEVPAAEVDLNAEKDHQLNILTEMLGVDVTSRKPKRDKTEKRDSFKMVRFDPSNPEHSKYLVKEDDLKKATEEEGREKRGKKQETEVESEKNSSKKKAKKEEEVEEEPVPVVMERFYKVSDKLKESLRKRTVTLGQEGEDLEKQGGSGGFSLLQKFGSPPSDNEEEEVEYSTKAITKNRNEWEKNPFRYDSSEEEDEVKSSKPSEEKHVKADKTAKEQSQTMKGITETFYFQENDPRLQEGLDFFGIKKTFAEMQEGFHEKRTDLKLIIKAKVRNNKRRNRPLKKKLGGARKHKKRMAGFGLKR